MAGSYAKYSGFGSGGGGGGGGVTSLNTLTGALTISAGTGISVTPSGGNTLTIAATGTTLTFSDSLVNNSGTVTLVNDSATPGNSKYYGTNSGGTLGYFSLPTTTSGNLTDAGTDGIVITGGTGAVLGSGTSIAQTKADGSHNGYLSSTDWSTFNNKQSTLSLGTVTETTSSILTLSGWTNATVGSPTIQVKQASGSQSGYLSSTDWTTFNNKGSGTVTAVSIASSNGFTGSSSGGSTPSLTLTGTLTGDITGAINSNSLTATTNSTLTTLSSLSLPLSQTTGVLTIAKGGTDNGTLAVSAGGVFYSDGTKFQNTGAGLSNQFLQSNGSSAPTWVGGTSLSYANYGTTVTGSVNSGNVAYTTLVNDSASAYNTSTGVYTIPTTGIYNIAASISISVTSGSFAQIGISKNGTQIAQTYQIESSALTNTFYVPLAINSVNCNSGDTITIQAFGNGSPILVSSTSSNFFTINQVNTNFISSVSSSLIGGMVTYGIYS